MAIRNHISNIAFHFLSVALLLTLALISTGCATVTRGAHEVLEVQTTPVGAEVTVYKYSKTTHDELTRTGAVSVGNIRDGWSDTGVAPAVFKLFRNNSYLVAVKAPGYRTSVVPVYKKPSGGGAVGVAGNLLLGGVVGLGVDAISGGANELKPNPVVVTLVPLYPPALTSAPPTTGAIPTTPSLNETPAVPARSESSVVAGQP